MKFFSAVLAVMLLAGAAAAGAQTHDEALLARGQYLTRLGDCRSCHTRPGGPAFGGGRSIDTPFGVFYPPNITPDEKTGIGAWSFDDFYRAMHDGIDADGNYLYPAFPYPSYTLLSRGDVSAIWAYLRSIAPVRQSNIPNDLRWPYSLRSIVMPVWRHFYFQAGEYEPAPSQSKQWNRGAYLVRGIAHCGACHTPRNRLGAKIERFELAGGSVAIDGWYPPNITPNSYAGIGKWSREALGDFLTTGRSERGDALGPMRDVVQYSLQHLREDDSKAMTAYLQSIRALGPASGPVGRRVQTSSRKAPESASERAAETGARIKASEAPAARPKTPSGEALYHQYCADCHGDDGQAKRDYYPDLRDNHVILSPDATNLLLIILRGGFQASTEAHPYPYSMPPFGFKLSDAEVTAIANFVRNEWSERTLPTVYPRQVSALR